MEEQERIPQAIWEGTFKIFGIDVRVAVLDTGERVVNVDDFYQVLTGEHKDPNVGDIEEFKKWQEGTGIPNV